MQNKSEEKNSNQSSQMPQKQKDCIIELAQSKIYKKCFKNIIPKYSQIDGLGLYAKDEIKKGSIVFSVPQEGMLYIDNLMKRQEDSVQNFICTLDLENKYLIFSILLFLEMNNSKSQWYSYLNEIWPQREQMNTSILWNQDKIKALSKKNYIDIEMKMRAELKQSWQEFNQKLEKEDEKIKEKMSGMNEEKFFYLVSIIQSRSIHFQCEMDSQSKVGALIPVYDLCNHQHISATLDAQSHFYFDYSLKQFIYKAPIDFNKHQQIPLQYGVFSDNHCLSQYGFNPSNSIHSHFEIEVPIVELFQVFGLRNLSKKHLQDMHTIFPEVINVMHMKYEMNPTYTFHVQINDGESILRWHDLCFLQALCLQKIDLDWSLPNINMIIENYNDPALKQVLSMAKPFKKLLFMQYIYFLENNTDIKQSYPDIHQLLTQEIEWIKILEIKL